MRGDGADWVRAGSPGRVTAGVPGRGAGALAGWPGRAALADAGRAFGASICVAGRMAVAGAGLGSEAAEKCAVFAAGVAATRPWLVMSTGRDAATDTLARIPTEM